MVTAANRAGSMNEASVAPRIAGNEGAPNASATRNSVAIEPRKPLVFGPIGSSPTASTNGDAPNEAKGASGDAVMTRTAKPASIAVLTAAIEVVLAPLCDSAMTSGVVVRAGNSAAKSSGS